MLAVQRPAPGGREGPARARGALPFSFGSGFQSTSPREGIVPHLAFRAVFALKGLSARRGHAAVRGRIPGAATARRTGGVWPMPPGMATSMATSSPENTEPPKARSGRSRDSGGRGRDAGRERGVPGKPPPPGIFSGRQGRLAAGGSLSRRGPLRRGLRQARLADVRAGRCPPFFIHPPSSKKRCRAARGAASMGDPPHARGHEPRFPRVVRRAWRPAV